jgi:hypothetical protein
MPKFNDDELQRGSKNLREEISALLESDPELGTFHEAFEAYCARKFALGTSATNVRIGGKNQKGIDFYSQKDGRYHIGQCKTPEPKWLEKHPSEVKAYAFQGVDDLREALEYLFSGPAEAGKAAVSESVKGLYAQFQLDLASEEFEAVFMLCLYGVTNQKGDSTFKSLKAEWEDRQPRIRIQLYTLQDLVEEYLLGTNHTRGEIEFPLRAKDAKVLSVHDFCYFLASAKDIHQAFVKFGWRLFDLNVRYELRGSSVNGDIVSSLGRHASRKRFHHYNNGLVILAKNFAMPRNPETVTVKGAQIVNGLQTVKSIHNAVSERIVSIDELDRDCYVQVKVIKNDEPKFIQTVVETTNNQNPMSARNLKSQAREQKILQTLFAKFTPRWFLQTKQGQWVSLTEENARSFKDVIGYPVSEFRPDPKRTGRNSGRVLDNEDLAKAWLCYTGRSDEAADRVTHFFSNDNLYQLAFNMNPMAEHWRSFASQVNFEGVGRSTHMAVGQASVPEYLFAYLLWEFTRSFVPSPRAYRELALQEGVNEGLIDKVSGSFKVTSAAEDLFLSDNATYQTWRLMANMKELLVEATAFLLAKKYGSLDAEVCSWLLSSPDINQFVSTGDVRDAGRAAAFASEFEPTAVVSRIFAFLKYTSQQFWVAKRETLLSTSRIRTVLLKREVAAEFKRELLKREQIKPLEEPWKPRGVSFLDSLPPKPSF